VVAGDGGWLAGDKNSITRPDLVVIICLYLRRYKKEERGRRVLRVMVEKIHHRVADFFLSVDTQEGKREKTCNIEGHRFRKNTRTTRQRI
jgi:hypothetical protein